MNNINGINSYSKLGAVGPTSSAGPGTTPQTPPATQRKPDEVQISSIARYLSDIAAMPSIRAEKVEQIRQALADGSYDLEGKLPLAIERMMAEYDQ